ncbi:hypothetical protein Baya_5913 [Bagarius yarrelli]|uniref:Uncharacterized protein n=1 Tax=Bagarius yarrelli TaxID=175774 RepID=A0A556TXY5_BAGYA|nr:hypothetical protein Baya_5913 [Bagarius yarrelli]
MADGGREIDFPEKLDIVKRGRLTPKITSLSQPGKEFVTSRPVQTSGNTGLRPQYHPVTERRRGGEKRRGEERRGEERRGEESCTYRRRTMKAG